MVLFLVAAVSTKAATLSGTVRDSEGAVITNAHVVVHWDPSGSNYLKDNLGVKQDIVATTDSRGHFSVELPPGFYDVFVTAMAFTPHCDKVPRERQRAENLRSQIENQSRHFKRAGLTSPLVPTSAVCSSIRPCSRELLFTPKTRLAKRCQQPLLICPQAIHEWKEEWGVLFPIGSAPCS